MDAAQTARRGRNRHHGGDPREPEWSSIPVSSLHSRPSANPAPTHQVRLPQLHRRFPAATAGTCGHAAAPAPRPSCYGQEPMHRGPAGRQATVTAQLERSPSRARPWVLPTHVADRGLHLGRQPGRARRRTPGPVRQSGKALPLEPAPPDVPRLPRRAVANRDLTHRTAAQHLTHRPVPVLRHCLLTHNPPVEDTPQRTVKETINRRQVSSIPENDRSTIS